MLSHSSRCRHTSFWTSYRPVIPMPGRTCCNPSHIWMVTAIGFAMSWASGNSADSLGAPKGELFGWWVWMCFVVVWDIAYPIWRISIQYPSQYIMFCSYFGKWWGWILEVGMYHVTSCHQSGIWRWSNHSMGLWIFRRHIRPPRQQHPYAKETKRTFGWQNEVLGCPCRRNSIGSWWADGRLCGIEDEWWMVKPWLLVCSPQFHLS